MLCEKMVIASTAMVGASIIINKIGLKKNNPTLLCVGVSLYFGASIPAIIAIVSGIKEK